MGKIWPHTKDFGRYWKNDIVYVTTEATDSLYMSKHQDPGHFSLHFSPSPVYNRNIIEYCGCAFEATASPYMCSNQDPEDLPLHFRTPAQKKKPHVTSYNQINPNHTKPILVQKATKLEAFQFDAAHGAV